MLKVGMLLHSKGFHVTFVNTEYNRSRFVRSHGPDAVKGLDDFRFETIPDGLPPSEDDATQDVPSICNSTSMRCLAPFRDLLAKLNHADATLPVTCIMSDGAMSFTLNAAEDLGIPDILSWTTSACGFMAYLHYRHLVSKGLVPLNDMADLTNGYLNTPIDCILGMNKRRLKDYPSFIRTTDPEDVMLRFIHRENSRATRGSAIILNTFDELELPVLDAMALILPPILSVGPLLTLTYQIVLVDSPLASINSSLWMEDTTRINWLDGTQPGLVVYVNSAA